MTLVYEREPRPERETKAERRARLSRLAAQDLEYFAALNRRPSTFSRVSNVVFWVLYGAAALWGAYMVYMR